MGSVQLPVPTRLGELIPSNDPHAVSVCLPTWEATIGWANRDTKVTGRMKTGYPRFYVNPLVGQLASKIITVSKGTSHLKGLPFPTLDSAQRCMRWVENKVQQQNDGHPPSPEDLTIIQLPSHCDPTGDDLSSSSIWDIYVVAVSEKSYAYLKSYWQHTGEGVSSRQASYFLRLLAEAEIFGLQTIRVPHTLRLDIPEKRGIKELVAQSYSTNRHNLDPSDVFLYQTGMKGIYDVYRALLQTPQGKKAEKAVAYGFTYVDTFKIIEGFGPLKAEMLGFGNAADLDKLEGWLKEGAKLLAVFCEYPGNPLLGCPDLVRIRKLSLEYEFVVVCDDTIGTAFNLDLLPHIDIVVTSLSKLFSGACNVMGGSVVVSPFSRRHDQIHQELSNIFVDTYFPEDAMVMKHNGSMFAKRVEKTNANALAIAQLLLKHPSVERVHYPALDTEIKEIYDRCKRPEGGYGYLLTIIFKKSEDAISFYNALNVAKGPSLGTDFTLCCPYTLFSHYKELEWAAQYGVTMHLIRVSVGRENIEDLKATFERALLHTSLAVEEKEEGFSVHVEEVPATA